MSPRVLMLGWEFPPFITGGLGTACFGLTKALDRLGVETTFILPKSTPVKDGSHVRLISPGDAARRLLQAEGGARPEPKPTRSAPKAVGVTRTEIEEFETINQQMVETEVHWDRTTIEEPGPGVYSNLYEELSPRVQQLMRETGLDIVKLRSMVHSGELDSSLDDIDLALFSALPEAGPPRHEDAIEINEKSANSADYSGDLVGQAERYARFCSTISRNVDFDVIHAHDWLTYPAGLAVSRISGKPLVVHVHSTEFDRSGEHVNQSVYNIERRGMHGAARVVAVSQLTKGIIVNRYGIDNHKVNVVWNGIDVDPATSEETHISGKDQLVLYFGRITLQKGPEYFIAAAKRVLEIMPQVKFVVAGSGDLAERMIRMAAEMGIGHKVLFTGFLRGKDIDRVFSIADLYVMPSVSEPFGIAPLEAMSHDVPVLISKRSGVSEVLSHALKVDFWDIDDMANKIIAVLRHSPLSKALRDGGRFELQRITWDGAARKCEQIYNELVADTVA
ncbi:MAG: glycosyltransferase [Planctomycetota bacterium]|nr:glycosyltransferase [Planctomycetota bacterium]MEC9157522.1 glycosyltransferase [Planctomycetota bacterium]MEC9233826.1 glycosyltransferase [Planctomycetota bacterium]